MTTTEAIRAARADQPDARLRLVFDESLRAVETQRDALATLGQRAAHLLAVASVVGSVLAALALRDASPPGAGARLGLAAFAVTVLLCAWVALPIPDLALVTSPTVLLDGYVDGDPPATLDRMHRDLALRLEARWDANQHAVARRVTGLRVAALLLAVAIAATALDLGTRPETVLTRTASARSRGPPMREDRASRGTITHRDR